MGEAEEGREQAAGASERSKTQKELTAGQRALAAEKNWTDLLSVLDELGVVLENDSFVR